MAGHFPMAILLMFLTTGSVPTSLHVVSIVALCTGGASALWVAFDVLGNRQQMWIMNIVYPVNCLYFGPVGVWFYYKYGRLTTKKNVERAKKEGREHPGKSKPFPTAVAVSASHCGSGCSLGDLCAEWLTFWTAWSLLASTVLAAWMTDYGFALFFGIAFQYFTIVPMKGLSRGEGIREAFKADWLSVSTWQIGMYGWMAIAIFVIFGVVMDRELKPNMPEFWFMMQIAMWFGFATSYPTNWWLLRRGIKEKM